MDDNCLLLSGFKLRSHEVRMDVFQLCVCLMMGVTS